jgi:hypothetical protein
MHSVPSPVVNHFVGFDQWSDEIKNLGPFRADSEKHAELERLFPDEFLGDFKDLDDTDRQRTHRARFVCCLKIKTVHGIEFSTVGIATAGTSNYDLTHHIVLLLFVSCFDHVRYCFPPFQIDYQTNTVK